MKSHSNTIMGELHFRQWIGRFALAIAMIVCAGSIEAAGVSVWDVGAKFGEAVNITDRVAWKAVPSDLFELEANPSKAASDPGYYGREFHFTGDTVVENQFLTAVVWAGKGRVVFYARGNGGQKIAEFSPSQNPAEVGAISRCEMVRNAGDEVVLRTVFSAGAKEIAVTFAFGRNEIVEIKPSAGVKGCALFSSLEYGIVPSFVGDDMILAPGDYPSLSTLNALSENCLVGLHTGEDSMLVMTWPKGKQAVRLNLAGDVASKRMIESVDFDNDGQSFYLGVLAAPGIWHRETLTAAHLEKAVASEWKRPFSAKWKTQLSEAGIRTSFTFHDAKNTIWRGVPGSYNYPVWFEGDAANYYLGKKVPPKGESIIYFLEGRDTPGTMSTPVDILKATLGRPAADAMLDVEGRKLRTHHRRAGDGVRRACTCGCTEAIQAVFEAGEETMKKEYICEALDDMIFFVQAHVSRIDEYRHFADEMTKYLRGQPAGNAGLKAYLDSLEEIAQQIPQEYDVQKENMKSPAYASELTRQTVALAEKKDPKNLPAYMELLKAWRGMGGAQDYVVARCHATARKLFQEAGYACVDQPAAMEVAQEIRARCRQVLRNPDGYEIWPEY